MSSHASFPARLRHGRGAVTNINSQRFDDLSREADPEIWEEEEPSPLTTHVTIEHPKTIINKIASPDLPFDKTINAYRGCEHGCIYCFARPTHAYHNLSPGLDFETHLFAKPNAAKLLEQELSRPQYRPSPIAMGTNTDPYQPIEKQYEITRQILNVLDKWGHPVTITTKSYLVTRDIDILSRLAKRSLVVVNVSITTLDHKLARLMEPRASTPKRRLAAIQRLCEGGIPVNVFVSPLIPGLNDHEIERILTAARMAGAQGASSILLRLPWEVRDLFTNWLNTSMPARASRILSLIQQVRGGKENDPLFGTRMRGSGPYADLLRARFQAACKKEGLIRNRFALSLDHFRSPTDQQLNLF